MTQSKTPSPEERFEAGRGRRKRIARPDLANPIFSKRNFDPLDALENADQGRVQDLLAVKYARMRQSPFAFFRGAVAIMAADLARLPHTGLHGQMCGDAHVQNLGSFAGPDGRLVFDINDFDETFRGPWEWDIKRMATSIILAGREANHKKSDCVKAVDCLCQSYARTVRKLSRLPVLEAARFRVHRPGASAPISLALKQSQRAQPADLLKRYTQRNAAGEHRFVNSKPTFWRITEEPLRKTVVRSLATYQHGLPDEYRHIFRFYFPVDIAFKVVGSGSVGLRDYVVLLEGNGENDPLFLQVKEEAPSIYAQYLPGDHCENQGMRVALGQRRMQPVSDVLLGWTTIDGRDFLVRHLNDHKGSIDIATLTGQGLFDLAVVAGELLARGHTRSGDSRAISGYIGSGKKASAALIAFAAAYADQTEKDFETFLQAIAKHRFPVSRKF